MGIYDVPAAKLIEEAAKDLKAMVKQPAFVPFVKSGAHKERVPNNPDWYYLRAASILYRVYREGEIGTGALRSYYGGRKNRGVRPEHKVKASGKIIRSAMQALEKEGLVKKSKKGRAITPKGEKFLFEKAKAAEVGFKASREAAKNALAERLAKAEQARQKAAEAAKIAAEQQRQKAAETTKLAALRSQATVKQGQPSAPQSVVGQAQKTTGQLQDKAQTTRVGASGPMPGHDTVQHEDKGKQAHGLAVGQGTAQQGSDGKHATREATGHGGAKDPKQAQEKKSDTEIAKEQKKQFAPAG